MKHLKKAVAFILLAALMLTLLSGCGEKEPGIDNSEPGAVEPGETPEFVWSAERVPVQGSFSNFFGNMIYNNGRLLTSLYDKIADNTPEGVVPEYEGQYWVYGDRLYWLNLDGTTEEISGYESLPLPEGRDGSSYMQQMLLAPDGTIYTLECVYSSWYDGPDEGDIERWSQEWYEAGLDQYYHSEEKYYLRHLAADGSELSCTDLSTLRDARNKMQAELGGQDGEAVGGSAVVLPAPMPIDVVVAEPVDSYVDEYFYVNDMELGPDGKLYFSADQYIFITDADGKVLGTLSLGDSYADSLVVLPDCVAVGHWDYSDPESYGQKLTPINAETLSFDEGMPIDQNISLWDLAAAPAESDYDFYYTNGVNFMGYRVADGAKEKILNWIDCDIDSSMMGRSIVLPDGRILVLEQEWNDDYSELTMHLAFLKQVPYDSVPHKKELVLATQYLNYNAQRNIVKFNKSNPEYRVVVRDYSEYNTEEDYSAGLTKLTTEILAGNVPDIIDLNGMPTDEFIAKGLLADLYPLLDADPELSREDFLPAVRNALEVDGHLYRTLQSFTVTTLFGGSAIVGEEPGWTLAEFKAALAKMPEGCTPLEESMTRDQILWRMLYMEIGNLVDWGTGECRFDSPAFRDILEFAAQFPETFEYPDDYVWTEEDNEANRIASGRQMLAEVYLYDFYDFQVQNAMFGGKATAIGYPVSEGVGNFLTFNDSGYAISAACAAPEAAWQFLRSFFLEGNNYYGGFPATQKAFDERLEEAMTPIYKKDGNGNFLLDENGEKIEQERGSWSWGSMEVKLYALKQEEADQIMELINSAERVIDQSGDTRNEELVNIITTDTQAYFLGQKPLDDVVRQLQSKLNILVNEKR